MVASEIICKGCRMLEYRQMARNDILDLLVYRQTWNNFCRHVKTLISITSAHSRKVLEMRETHFWLPELHRRAPVLVFFDLPHGCLYVKKFEKIENSESPKTVSNEKTRTRKWDGTIYELVFDFVGISAIPDVGRIYNMIGKSLQVFPPGSE